MADHTFERPSNTQPEGGDAVPDAACGLLAGGGALSGFLAFFAASCCVLPLILVSLGVGSTVIAQLGVLVRLQPWFAGAGVVLVIAGLVAAFRGGRRPRWRHLAVLLAAAAFVGLSFVVPLYETEILQWLNGR